METPYKRFELRESPSCSGRKQEGEGAKENQGRFCTSRRQLQRKNSCITNQERFDDIELNNTFIQDVCIICGVFRNAIEYMNHENDTQVLGILTDAEAKIRVKEHVPVVGTHGQMDRQTGGCLMIF